MKNSEILRVVKLCLPQVFAGEDGAVADIDRLKQSDLQISTLCSLWAGMGHIYKVTVVKSPDSNKSKRKKTTTLAIKHVAAGRQQQSLGDRRKAFSYQVEANFYEKLAPTLIERHGLDIPKPYHVDRQPDTGEIVIAMSYMDSKGSSYRSSMKLVLTWLATLHTAYWGTDKVDAIVQEVGLQPIGNYWYLDTRPDEHASYGDRLGRSFETSRQGD
jgi:hypothetical protein